MPSLLYETDFYTWTQRQAELLRAEEFDRIDWQNLAEEVESLGRSDKRQVENRLIVLILHLLKWQYQTGKRGPSWRSTIREQRRRIERVLQDSSSLKAQVRDLVVYAYPYAVGKAEDETGLPTSTFPSNCPYTAEQILDIAFWPGLKQS